MSASPTDCEFLEDRTHVSCTNLLINSMCYLVSAIVKHYTLWPLDLKQ